MVWQWWTGFAYSENTILVVQNDLTMTNFSPTNLVSVRPVIMVPKSELKFNEKYIDILRDFKYLFCIYFLSVL
mgnify:CR=1 FL=1